MPAIVIYFAAGMIDDLNNPSGNSYGPASLLATLLCLVPSLAGGAKRCRDRARSGWWLLLGLVPVIGSVWLFIDLCCLRATAGPHQYGNDPISTRHAAIAWARRRGGG